jgi:hypothetical protein
MPTQQPEPAWFNALRGMTVTRIAVDDAITLRCTNGRRTFEFALEGPFELVSTDGVRSMIAPDGDPTLIGPVLGLLLDRVASATLSMRGELEVRFAGGPTIKLEAEEAFSSWRLTEGTQLVMASMPEAYALVRPSGPDSG